MVSFGMLLFAAFTAVDAGRLHDTGTGAMWIAPELVARPAPAQLCGQVASWNRRDLVFEKIHPDDIDDQLLMMATPAREVVSFEWNPATGELGFSTTATSGVFSDLAPSSPADAGRNPNCGSR